MFSGERSEALRFRLFVSLFSASLNQMATAIAAGADPDAVSWSRKVATYRRELARVAHEDGHD